MVTDYLYLDDSDLELISFIADEMDQLYRQADILEKEYFQDSLDDADLISDKE